jgi:hypothetical protein
VRKWKLIAVAGLAVLVAAGAFILWPQPCRVTLENVRRIHSGMSPQEVEAILGPAGDHSTRPLVLHIGHDSDDPTIPFEPSDGAMPREGRAARIRWTDDGGTVRIFFFSTGRTYCDAWEPSILPLKTVQQGPPDILRWRAKRLWRKWFP